MPKDPTIRKVLIIGSGPIVIGQAAEFDYAGTQACLAVREEGVEVVLVNSNPATIQTDPDTADRVYIEPLTVESLAEIIRKELPDGLIATMGGQTALNLAMDLERAGVLERVRRARAGHLHLQHPPGRGPPAFRRPDGRAGQPVLPHTSVIDLWDGRRVRRAARLSRWWCARPSAWAAQAPATPPTCRELEALVDAGLRGKPRGHGAPRAERARLGRDRVRGAARRRRQRHHRLQHGEHGPDGRPHRRVYRRRAQPDPLRRATTSACARCARDRARARRAGRLQLPVRAQPGRRASSPSSRSTPGCRARRLWPPRRPATPSPAWPPRSPSATLSPSCATTSPAPAPAPSLPSTTWWSSCRAGPSTSSATWTRASA